MPHSFLIVFKVVQNYQKQSITNKFETLFFLFQDLKQFTKFQDMSRIFKITQTLLKTVRSYKSRSRKVSQLNNSYLKILKMDKNVKIH